MSKQLSITTLQSLHETFAIQITDKKFLRIADNVELTAIIPNDYLGYYHSMVKLKQLGYDINQYGDLKVLELNPKRFKPLT